MTLSALVEVPRVHSINTSGHKFGLTYVGLGTSF